jgi:NitT/TauT family transport system substrate-binding protein
MRLSLAAIIGCLALFPAVTRADPAPQKITVAEFGDLLIYLPVYIAQQNGYFASQGLDVSAVTTGNDDKTFAALVSGDAQFGVSDPTFAAIARSRGNGGKVVAAVVGGLPFWGVANDAKIAPITDAMDLKGHSVATYPAPSTAYTLQAAMFKSAGLTPDIRQAAYGTLLPLLESGQVDIALELEPNVSTAVKNGSHIVYSLAKTTPDFLITGVEVTDDFAKQHRDTVGKFVAALDAAEKFAHAHPEEAVKAAQKHFPDLPPDVIDHAVRRMLDEGTMPASAVVSEKGWTNALQLRVDAGDLPSLEAAAGTLDNSFAQQAQKP